LTVVSFSVSSLLADEPADVESKFLKNVRQVTFGMTRAGEGYFSPDGSQIVYQAVPKDYVFYQIYRQPLREPFDQQKPIRISTGRGRTTCAYFSPDGKKVLFASSHLDPRLEKTEADERRQQAEDAAAGVRRRYKWDFDPHMDLFVSGVDGKDLKRLTDAKGYDAEGSYSADGKQIVFCSDRDGDPDLYVINADGSNLRQLTDAPGYDGGPFFSPDGRYVVYRSDERKAERLQIRVIDVATKKIVELTSDLNWVNWAPYWHPKRPYILWGGADHSDPNARPNYDLWLLKYSSSVDKFMGSGSPTRITNHASADVLPVFSPDGKQLMWTSSRTSDRSSQLFIADFVLPSSAGD
jgi:Tol biopolymer transport system component